jgi:hypothetical protein
LVAIVSTQIIHVPLLVLLNRLDLSIVSEISKFATLTHEFYVWLTRPLRFSFVQLLMICSAFVVSAVLRFLVHAAYVQAIILL